LRAETDLCVTVTVPFEKIVEGRRVVHLPRRVLLRHVDAKLLHLGLKVVLVVAERALEEVASRLGQGLDARPVEPAATTRRPEPIVRLGVVGCHVLEADAARHLGHRLFCGGGELAILLRPMV
jgi:hypothetical protein